MRHLKAGRKLGRTSAHRKALFKNMVTALIERERIRTTLAKAKELRSKVEKTITLGKKGTLHARRHALRLVADKGSLKKVFGPLAERYASRPGGYTRIIKLGHRHGDDAPMAFIELVDREGEEAPKAPAKGKKQAKAPAKKTTPQKSGDGKKKATEAAKKKGEGEKKKAPEKKAKAPAKKAASSKKKVEKKDSKGKGKDKK
ncbi:50S ribosomal protein L17 [Candidatus Nitromaritima sp. SCGC AAA799-A02]|nr:50S ribosomal protein L17 [Candidatus Nitromaritima sp. SCGC AAA799-A02]